MSGCARHAGPDSKPNGLHPPSSYQAAPTTLPRLALWLLEMPRFRLESRQHKEPAGPAGMWPNADGNCTAASGWSADRQQLQGRALGGFARAITHVSRELINGSSLCGLLADWCAVGLPVGSSRTDQQQHCCTPDMLASAHPIRRGAGVGTVCESGAAVSGNIQYCGCSTRVKPQQCAPWGQQLPMGG